MAGIHISDLADHTAATLADLGPPRFQQIAQSLQRYEVLSRWLKKDKVMFNSGSSIKRNLMLQTGGVAEHAGLFATDDTNIWDHLAALDAPWKHAKTQWGFERREALMNRGKALVTNVIEPRRMGAMIDLADELEAGAWQAPSSTTTDLSYGIPYWIVSNATTGFNGGLPTGHTTIAGINITTYPNFKNYTYTYTNVTKADLIKKLRTAHRKCRWISPESVKDYRSGLVDQFRLYVDETTIAALEDLGEQQNENLGRDLAPMGGARDVKFVDDVLVFRKHPIIWIPYLDDNSPVSSNPVYMIDHSVFNPVVLAGDYLVESKPEKAPLQHNALQVFVDLTYNFICLDRRRCSVGYIA
jgi:hypothetical protein